MATESAWATAKVTTALNTGVSSAASVTMATVVLVVHHVNRGEKQDKFNDMDFKRWQQKMLFYVTTLNLARYLKEHPPIVSENEQDTNVWIKVHEWTNGDYLCRHHGLNGLHDSLYDVYSVQKIAKALWECLEKKYKTEDVGSKKFIVGRFLDFKMIDSKTVTDQIQQFQFILHEIDAEGMNMPEVFQVDVMIKKLPLGWRDFQNYLNHKRKEISIKDLLLRLRIQEDNKKKIVENSYKAKGNVVELSQSSGYKKKNAEKRFSKGFKLGPKGAIAKKP